MKYFFLAFAIAAAPACADAAQQQSLPPEAQAQIQELYRERNDARAAADYWQSSAIEARAQLAQAQSEIAKLQAQVKAPHK
jgi:uncharacterized coiled-coil DUF342 family protein